MKDFISKHFENAFQYFPEQIMDIALLSIRSESALNSFRECGYLDDSLNIASLMNGCRDQDVEKVTQAFEQFFLAGDERSH